MVTPPQSPVASTDTSPQVLNAGNVPLTEEQLFQITLLEIWKLCDEDRATFVGVVDAVAERIGRYRNIALPDAEVIRARLLGQLEPMLESGGEQRFAALIDIAVRATVEHGPVPAETIAAYNEVRDCQDKRLLCHAPTTSMYFGRDGNVTACCYTRASPLGRFPEQTIESIWRGEKIREIRDSMRLNILPLGCETCADQLRAHNFRGLLAGNFDSFVKEPVAPSLFERLTQFLKRKEALDYPTRMEFELSNKCNLECAMCSGLFSSSIRANREGKPPLAQMYDGRFVEQLKPFVPYLKQAKFLGGEPFLIDIYYEIWELFIATNPACEITITTNGTVFTSKVQRVLEKLNFNVVISLDSITKPTYEKIRVNAVMERTLENLDKLTAILHERGRSVTMAVCPMISNWREIPGMVEFANSRGMTIFFNTVTYPLTASLKFLPADEQMQIAETLKRGVGEAKTDIEGRNFRALHDLGQQVEMWAAEELVRMPALLPIL